MLNVYRLRDNAGVTPLSPVISASARARWRSRRLDATPTGHHYIDKRPILPASSCAPHAATSTTSATAHSGRKRLSRTPPWGSARLPRLRGCGSSESIVIRRSSRLKRVTEMMSGVSPTYEHIVSRAAHGEFVNGVYERLRQANREVWFGSDGSGLMTETWIRSSFFTEEQRKAWQTVRHRAAREDPTPSMDLFAAGCLPGHGPMLSKLPVDASALASQLEAQRMLTLHGIAGLIGEALVPDLLLRVLHHVAARLPGAGGACDRHRRNRTGRPRDLASGAREARRADFRL